MKKLIILSLALFALMSCNKDGLENKGQPYGSASLAVSFPGIKTPDSRAPYDNGVQNPSEVYVTTMNAYIFDAGDSYKLIQVSPAIFGGTQTTFPLGIDVPGKTVKAVFIANDNIPTTSYTIGTTTYTDFRSVMTAEISGKLTGPFMMTVESNDILIEEGIVNPAGSLALVRLASRIDITNTVANNLAAVVSAQILTCAKTSPVSFLGTPCSDFIAACTLVDNQGYNTTTGVVGDAGADMNLMWSQLYCYENDNSTANKTQVKINYTWGSENRTATVDFKKADGTIIPIQRNYRYEIVISDGSVAAPEFTVYVLPWNLADVDETNIGASILNITNATFGTAGTIATTGATEETIYIGYEAQDITFDVESDTQLTPFLVTDLVGNNITWLTPSHTVVPTRSVDNRGGFLGGLKFEVEENKTPDTRTCRVVVYNAQMSHVFIVIQDVKPGEAANSYILNPPASGTTVYKMHPTQVDIFWGADYANVPANLLSTTTDWTVDVLWMDEAGMVTRTAGGSDIWISKATGTGVNDTFQITVPSTAKKGSFVVYLYKTADGVAKTKLWSWHMWVTDYDPSAALSTLTPVAGQYVYPVVNGDVHRYGDPKTAPAQNYWWGAGSIYENSFIMDRNLGQRSVYPALPTSSSNENFYYQWGRKDPFPANVSLWDLDGPVTYSATANLISQASVTMANAVNNPFNYYKSGGLNWITESYVKTSPYPLWNDKKITATGTATMEVLKDKSLFDPCPAGWALPTSLFCKDFVRNTGTVWNDNRAGLAWNIGGNQGMRYWPLANAPYSYLNTDPVGGTILFTPAGYRDESAELWLLNSSDSYYTGQLSSSTSVNPGAGTASRTVVYTYYGIDSPPASNSLLQPSQAVQMCWASPVRCIKRPE